MELYDAMFYRRSIKNYSNKSLKKPLMDEVKEICSNINYLNKDLKIKAHVVERGHLIKFLMGKHCNVNAQHYILVTSNKGEDYLQNVGYALEEVVLKLTGLGIATSWMEPNLKRDDILDFIELDDNKLDDIFIKNDNKIEESMNEEIEEEINFEEPVAVVAFGYPERDQQLFRDVSSKKLDRKDIKNFSKGFDSSWESILNSVKVSPSINNTQPWILYNKNNNIYLYEEKQKKSLKYSSNISMGISLKHFEIGCKKNNINIAYEKTSFKKKLGKTYFITIVLKETQLSTAKDS